MRILVNAEGQVMLICSKEEFRNFVEHVPNLCVNGLVSSDYCRFFKVDFYSSRNLLLETYEDFIACCNWLSGCRFDDYATHFSPGSDRLLARLNSTFDHPMQHGTLIAAVLFMELPHVIPGNSPGLTVGVSRFCPRLSGART
ncbi:MAG: hypothetical protein L3J63_00555 [Geopsychrobacter sp.]|nr:hypothetical protein [Geopsychrobacter sp.]